MIYFNGCPVVICCRNITTNIIPNIVVNVNLNGSAGVEEITKKKNSGDVYSVFPNPNNGSLTFKLHDEQMEGIIVEIFNGLGQLVYTGKFEMCFPFRTYSIETGIPTGGIYFVRIGNKNSFEIKKIIVE